VPAPLFVADGVLPPWAKALSGTHRIVWCFGEPVSNRDPSRF
jgi:hypothetical protein